MGRSSKYWQVEENLLNGNIKEWAKTCAEYQIALKCGVSVEAFNKYKLKHPEIAEEIRKGKIELNQMLKSKLIEKALGEIKITKTKRKETEEFGTRIVEFEEITTEELAPDLGAIHLLLKNNDPDWHQDDTRTLEIKMQDVDFKKKDQIAKYLVKKKD